MSKLPNWMITGLVWIIGGVVMYFLLFSCSVLHPLPGLCYTDKTGTYICPKEIPENLASNYDYKN